MDFLEGVVGEILLATVLLAAFALGKYQSAQRKPALWRKKDADFSVSVREEEEQEGVYDDEATTPGPTATSATTTVTTTAAPTAQAASGQSCCECRGEEMIVELQDAAFMDAVIPVDLMLERDRQFHLDHDHILQHELEREVHHDLESDVGDGQDKGERDLEHLLKCDSEALGMEFAHSVRETLMLHTELAQLPSMSVHDSMLENDRHAHLKLDRNLQLELEREVEHGVENDGIDGQDNSERDLEHLLKCDNDAVATEFAHSARETLMLHTQLAELSCMPVFDTMLKHDHHCHVELDRNLQRELEGELEHVWEEDVPDGSEDNERNLKYALERDSEDFALEFAHSARDALTMQVEFGQMVCEPVFA